jgi:integrase/recombinase XerD
MGEPFNRPAEHARPGRIRRAPASAGSRGATSSAARSELDAAVGDFLAYLRVECGLSPNTIESYAFDLQRMLAFLEGRSVRRAAELDGTLLIEHLRQLRREELAGSSIARHLATVRAFGRFLAGNGYCTQDPAELLERPAVWRNLPRTIHTRQIERLLAAPQPGEKMYLRDVAALETMYATGCRASELGAIALSDYHEPLGVVKLSGKGRRQRIVPIGRPAMVAVRRYLDELRPELLRDARPAEAMFLTERGEPMTRFTVWAMIKKHARRAGMRDVHPHTLRHTFATHLLGGGADLRVVQELLGHARVTTTQIYTHVDQSRLKSVIANHHPRP